MTNSKQNSDRLRLLVGIASYGEKNLPFLRKIIETYQSMPINVDLVVFSDAPKSLMPGVKVIVGLPTRNPWSLPFAHKALFAQCVDQYDIFLYSEDDMHVQLRNIRSFLRASAELRPDELAGFLRYEDDPDGNRFLPDVHECFHWKPDSVQRRGEYTVAEFTNEHSACYILTQTQLKKAIASGGYLNGPGEGRYGMPETAATDPYTRCGFRKVVCISSIEDFLIHHMSNRYIGQIGLPFSSFEKQIQSLEGIVNGVLPISKLCDVESKMRHLILSKSYYEESCKELIELTPKEARSILSVGCGWGATEASLKQRGASVTALPLDSVIGDTAARHGIKIINGTLDECMDRIGEKRFDCVIISNMLHLQPDPGRMIERCSRHVGEEGTLLIKGPNFTRIPTLIKRSIGVGDHRKLRNFHESGINVCGPEFIARYIRNAGFRSVAVKWHNHAIDFGKSLAVNWHLGRLTARDWVIQSRKTA